MHVHFADDGDPERVLHRVMDELKRMEGRMSKQMDDLAATVEKVNQVEASAVTLIRGLAEQIKDAGTDANKLNELRDSLLAQAAQLGDAVAANTPAVPAPPADEPPAPPAQP